jgi:hypothetical protein
MLKSYLTSEKYPKAPKILGKFLDMIRHPMHSKNIFRAFENVFLNTSNK